MRKIKNIQWSLLLLLVAFAAGCKKGDNQGLTTIPQAQVGSFVDARDGNTYKTITINGTTWMAENLKFRLRDGSFDNCLTYGEEFLSDGNIKEDKARFKEVVIEEMKEGGKLYNPDAPFNLDLFEKRYLNNTFFPFEFWARFPPNELKPFMPVLWEIYRELLVEAKTKMAYDNADLKYAEEFGYLYSLEAAQKAVPEGWHIATDEEWKELETALGMNAADLDLMEAWRGSDQGKALMGNSTLGFNAKLGGTKIVGKSSLYGGDYVFKDIYGYFWTSTLVETQAENRIYIIRKVSTQNDGIYRGTSLTNNEQVGAYLSVRCVKDK